MVPRRDALGWYKVTVSTQLPPGVPGGKSKNTLNAIYQNPGLTPLTIEVVASPAPGQYDLKLKP